MFNSRDTEYRNPVGAVKQGQTVHFKISPEREIQCQQALLIIISDKGQEIHNMFWCGMNGEHREWWECDFTPEEKAVYFYHFELQTNRGHMHIFKGVDGEVVHNSSGASWQLTVYDKDLSTPDWLAGGIIYQIFPDRFHFSGKEKENIPYGRTLRDDWGNTPVWQANEKGEITNSDYFKGDLQGICEKLSYLKDLGITCIYLNPIFEAHSNHRYNTADYSKIDPLLGDDKDFENLCDEAEKLGIKIILDGVFSHTGSDSIYFNREGRYDSLGAFNSQNSEYYPWYNFRNWNNDYESWWGFITLPNVNETNPQYNEYITGDNGIIQKWIKKGSSGWRLDVADELPDQILDNIYKATKKADPEAIVMGEVWEDASNKMAYGERRRYLLGGQMDTVMNYPFRDAILGFLTGARSSICMENIENIAENYPPEILRLLMNHIGTHDTERAITILAGQPQHGRDRAWQNATHMNDFEWQVGIQKMKIASFLQFTLPGVPSIYYGDEVGVEGYKDPFNRACFPWGKENLELLDWHKQLCSFRKSHDIFKDGQIRNIYSHGEIMCFKRFDKEKTYVCVANRGHGHECLPFKADEYSFIFGDAYVNHDKFILPPHSVAVLIKNV